MNRMERRDFVANHRTAVFGTTRRSDGPALSIVYYVSDGDDLLVSTMGERAKAKAVERLGKVSLCVLDEQWPPTYVVVYCDARVEREPEGVVDLMMRIAGVMAGKEMPETVRPLVAEGARKEGRVVLRLTPYATFCTPPRHVHDEGDVNEELTHELGNTLPW
ncbi:MAG: pyridoxamine 5'-phosphate oxidase family protein [Myxococcota bacterium]|nr:pyridoxamine 5'-phosphate oxidase family protein [Myxococcales bacterium]